MSDSRSRFRRGAGPVEAAAWSVGCALLALYGGGRWYFSHSNDHALEMFRDAQQSVQQQSATAVSELESIVSAPAQWPSEMAEAGSRTESLTVKAPDMTLWSAGRIDRFAGAESPGVPKAILRIDALQLEVPIYAGTDEWNLNRGAGLIAGTAPLGADGNTGLAAHRDGYFRSLQNIRMGDRLEIETLDARYSYLVNDIRIVSPESIEVLASTGRSMLTLVTCYPFYFVGPAPARFVVHAERARASAMHVAATGRGLSVDNLHQSVRPEP